MMRPSFVIACFVCVVSGCTPAVDVAQGAVIFGEDDRREVIDTPPMLRERALGATAMMVSRSDVRVAADGSVNLNARGSLGDWLSLCPDEAFVDQPSVGTCSGVLVDNDLVLTAGHCIDEIPCRDQSWVLGWHRHVDGSTPASPDQVRRCASVLASSYTDTEDYALVRLDSPVAGRPALIARGGGEVGDRVDVSGHPYGLPMKVEVDAPVTSTPNSTQFLARVDVMPGSSGGPIWDNEGRLLGVIHGGTGFFGDLVLDGSCRRVRVVAADEPLTDIVTRAEVALEALCRGPNARPGLCCPGCGDAGSSPDAFRMDDVGGVPVDALDAGVTGSDAGQAQAASCAATRTRHGSWLALLLAGSWLNRLHRRRRPR